MDQIDIETIRIALHTGQKSTRKDAAQAAFARLVEALEVVRKREADERTLDDWMRAGDRDWAIVNLGDMPHGFTCQLECSAGTSYSTEACHAPDEARAKAAAWVRGQAVK